MHQIGSRLFPSLLSSSPDLFREAVEGKWLIRITVFLLIQNRENCFPMWLVKEQGKIYHPKRRNIVSLMTVRAKFHRVTDSALTSPFYDMA